MLFFFFKQKTAYEMRISDWSSDVCSSDLWAWAKSPSRRRRTSCACSTRYRARRLPTVGRPDAPDAGAPMKVTILGCGASPGVPRIDGVWGDCDPAEPKNRRTRGSIVVEEAGTRLLIDTSPDLRHQFIDNGITEISAILWSHDHAHPTHGIADIRFLAYAARGQSPGLAAAFPQHQIGREP